MDKFKWWLSEKKSFYWLLTDDIYENLDDVPKQMLIRYMIEYLKEQPESCFIIYEGESDKDIYEYLKSQIESMEEA